MVVSRIKVERLTVDRLERDGAVCTVNRATRIRVEAIQRSGYKTSTWGVCGSSSLGTLARSCRSRDFLALFSQCLQLYSIDVTRSDS